MKLDTIRKRLSKDRPMISVTLRMPADVIDDLKRIGRSRASLGTSAPARLCRGGPARDLDRYEGDRLAAVLAQLRAQGVPEKAIKTALKKSA